MDTYWITSIREIKIKFNISILILMFFEKGSYAAKIGPPAITP